MAEELLPEHPHAAGGLYYQTVGDFPPIPHDTDLIFDDPSLPDQFFDLDFDLGVDMNLDDICFVEALLVDPDSSASPESAVISNDAAALTDPIAPSCPLSIISPSNSISASPDLGDRVLDVEGCDAVRVLTQSSPAVSRESSDRGQDACGVSVYAPCESGGLEQQSSHGSGGCDSGGCQGAHSPSRSGNSERDVSSSFNFVKQNPGSQWIEGKKVKVEDATGNKSLSKRKKEVQQQQEENVESRSSKFRKSSMASENTENFSVGVEEDEKKKARLMRNRESAQLSRQRKKQYVEELEDKVRAMRATIADLNGKISFIMAENASLRQQLSGSGVCPPPPPGMYPVATMAYPWMPCPPYAVKPQGSQVPLVPIPRLKSQNVASAPKKSEGKKSEGKTKKVASITFLGLLFFILLFGGLVPMVNVKYGGIGETGFLSGRFDDTQRGMVLTLNSHLNGTDHGGSAEVSGGRDDHGNGQCLGVNCRRLASDMERKEHDVHVKPDSGGFSSVENSSEPLVASLYVPRNDKMVKIDGNLIIHSIMATEKVRSSATEGKKIGEETSLALSRNYGLPYPIPAVGRSNPRHSQMDRDSSGRHRALGSGSTENLRSSPSDGKLQQWFREGLAGPMLSSGMCTEVFQFEVSATPGAVVPAAPVANNAAPDTSRNATRVTEHRNRRIFRGTSVPVNSHALNVTEEHKGPNLPKDGLPGNYSRSSIIVNVLVDPREVGDGEGIMGAKALSRIFVVVLIDSVKYVTYSCMLPRVGSGPQLVTS